MFFILCITIFIKIIEADIVDTIVVVDELSVIIVDVFVLTSTLSYDFFLLRNTSTSNDRLRR